MNLKIYKVFCKRCEQEIDLKSGYGYVFVNEAGEWFRCCSQSCVNKMIHREKIRLKLNFKLGIS